MFSSTQWKIISGISSCLAGVRNTIYCCHFTKDVPAGLRESTECQYVHCIEWCADMNCLISRNALTEQAGLGGSTVDIPELSDGGDLHRQLPPGPGPPDGRHTGDTSPRPPRPQLPLPYLGHHRECYQVFLLPHCLSPFPKDCCRKAQSTNCPGPREETLQSCKGTNISFCYECLIEILNIISEISNIKRFFSFKWRLLSNYISISGQDFI